MFAGWIVRWGVTDGEELCFGERGSCILWKGNEIYEYHEGEEKPTIVRAERRVALNL